MFTCDVASESVDPRSNGRAGHGKIKREASERDQGGRGRIARGGGGGGKYKPRNCGNRADRLAGGRISRRCSAGTRRRGYDRGVPRARRRPSPPTFLRSAVVI